MCELKWITVNEWIDFGNYFFRKKSFKPRDFLITLPQQFVKGKQ